MAKEGLCQATERNFLSSLTLWNDAGARPVIEAFVAAVTQAGSTGHVPPEARVAVFDNDGTLWPERPVAVELLFCMQRLATMGTENPSLREQQPWRAAYNKDYAWFRDAVTRHYYGGDSRVRVLIAGLLRAFEGMRVEEYHAAAASFLQKALHPTLKRRFSACGYAPMVELLRYLEANGFASYIVSDGERDFMRVVTQEIYGVPEERVIGSSSSLRYTEDDNGGTLAYLARPDIFDDGPAKPVRIWGRIGRRPLVACGNSNGDIEMLKFAGGPKLPALRLLLRHDDPERDPAYTAGAERAVRVACAEAWTMVSVKRDWKAVLGNQP